MIHSPFMHFKPSMKKASFEVALKGKKQIAEGTFEFVFEKPKGFTFKAGQHVRMTLKGDSRFLTLVNTPQEKNLIVAMRMSGSAFKISLNDLKIGEKVLIQILLNVPHGAFALHRDSSIPAVFLVGGIGIVPAYSMIKDATERKLKHKIFLFYSNIRPEDAPYLDDLQTLAKKNSNFTLVATMTEPAKSWNGERGFIDQAMLRRYIEYLQTPIYYIAGLTGMVNARKSLLKELNVNEDNIRAEDFSGFKMGLMNDVSENIRRNILLFVIIFIVLAVVFAHIIAAISISKSDLALFNNPILYVMIGLMVVIIPFKLKHLLGLIWSKKRNLE